MLTSTNLKTALASSLMLLAADFAVANDTMNGKAFDDYTRGKTLFYGHDGTTYGAEIYLDNRRVRWSLLDGQCKDGYWYEQAGQICFVYEDDPSPRCWGFTKQDGKLTALFANVPGATRFQATEHSGAELACLAPNLGV